MGTTGTTAGTVFQSLHLLALLGMRESGADGYTLYVFDPGSGLSVEKCSSGWAVPGTGRDGVEVISFPLRATGVETARLVFGFVGAGIPPRSQLVLGRIIEAVQALWNFAQRAEAYGEIAARVAVLEVELAGSKISDRARGLLDKGLNESDAIGTLIRHVETVLRPRPSSELLEQLLKSLREELAARELTAKAKAVLQSTRGMSEEEAHHHLRNASRRSRRTVTEVARALIGPSG
jgi:hypothetical protein